MVSQWERTNPFVSVLPKAPTGISGLDKITGGGLPKGRPTIVCGGAGSGKTLLGVEFLVHGAAEYDEPGLFLAFEETPGELTMNVASLGFDLERLIADKKLLIDHIYIDRSEIEETGEYDLEGLFIRLGYLIDSIGAKRVVLDTVEALFGALSDTYILRSELRRLFNWLKQKGVTAVITAERGDGTLTRHGLEEYVSDCVILLDHRVTEQVSTRRLRIVKYRGTAHGTNEYPFLIDRDGFSVLPITSVGLDHQVTEERVSIGVPQLDDLMGGRGLYRGSTVLVSGTAGSGKSSLAAHFVHAACQRGERSLYLASEESRHQIIRNMRSIGIDLQPWVEAGLLHFHNARPTASSLELYLTITNRIINEFQPQAVVIDPITNFNLMGNPNEVKAMLMRLIDNLKSCQITTMMTSLTGGGDALEQTEVGISSLIDTWILLRDMEANGERNRLMYLLKSRGMPHSNQLREFLLTSNGIRLVDVYVGAGGVLTGSARAAQEAQERAAALAQAQEVERLRLNLERKRRALEAQIAALRANFDAEAEELYRIIDQQAAREQQIMTDRADMARHRTVYSTEPDGGESGRRNGI
ncbi:MAG: circadian clock protein KaiC [Chloroflexi bacterium]|nr:circadian clock protein KaiC [Chloroflexota bacterium]